MKKNSVGIIYGGDYASGMFEFELAERFDLRLIKLIQEGKHGTLKRQLLTMGKRCVDIRSLRVEWLTSSDRFFILDDDGWEHIVTREKLDIPVQSLLTSPTELNEKMAVVRWKNQYWNPISSIGLSNAGVKTIQIIEKQDGSKFDIFFSVYLKNRLDQLKAISSQSMTEYMEAYYVEQILKKGGTQIDVSDLEVLWLDKGEKLFLFEYDGTIRVYFIGDLNLGISAGKPIVLPS